MSDIIIIAIIAACGTLGSSIMTGLIVNSHTRYRVGLLEEKVDEHNNLVERMVKVEQSSSSAHHRLDEFFARLEGVIDKIIRGEDK